MVDGPGLCISQTNTNKEDIVLYISKSVYYIIHHVNVQKVDSIWKKVLSEDLSLHFFFDVFDKWTKLV